MNNNPATTEPMTHLEKKWLERIRCLEAQLDEAQAKLKGYEETIDRKLVAEIKYRHSMPDELWRYGLELYENLEEDIRDGTFDKLNNRHEYLEMIQKEIAKIEAWKKENNI